MNPTDRTRALDELAELARRSPRLRAHLDDEAAREAHLQEMPMTPEPEEVAVRVTIEIASRADRLAEVLADDPRLREHGRASRAAVIRLAATIGMDALEAQQDVAAALRSQDPARLTAALMPFIVRATGEFEAARAEAATHGAQVVAAPEHPEGPWLVIRDVAQGFMLDDSMLAAAVLDEPEILAGGATPAEAVRAAFGPRS